MRILKGLCNSRILKKSTATPPVLHEFLLCNYPRVRSFYKPLTIENMSLGCLTFSKFLTKIPGMVRLQIRVKLRDGITDSLQFWFVDRPYRTLRGGSRIYKRGGLTQGTNLLGRGVRSTLPSMQSMLELGGSGGMPPQENFEK